MKAAVLTISIAILIIIGEVKCIIKMCKCNWDPIGKEEIFYTIGTFTGLGFVIGWIDIQDK